MLAAHFWLPDLELSSLGVRLFFVLSGFLLTTILLADRHIAESRQVARSLVLRDFYARRILRIWPAYYATLIAALFLGAGSVAATFGWHALFASNILFYLQQQWSPGLTAHLWTLAVEEQFYLVLPLVVLFLPRKSLLPLLSACIAGAILYRALAAATVTGALDFYFVLPIAQLDALVAGGVLALLGSDLQARLWKALLLWSLPVAAAAYLAPLPAAVEFTVAHAVYLLPMIALVAGAASGIGGPLGAVLSNRAIVGLGRISYGVYLYHIFVAAALNKLVRSFTGAELWGTPAAFALHTVATIAVASASWFVLERPALKLKRFVRGAAGGVTPIPASPTRA